MAKRTKGEYDELVEQVKLLIIKAHTDYAIVKTLTKNHGIGVRMAQKYLKKAHEQITAGTKINVEKERGESIKRLKYLIQKAIDAGQLKTAMQGQAQLDKLTGASHQEVVKHTIEMSPLVGKDGKQQPNGFLAMIVNAREGAAALEEEMIEQYRKDRNAE